MSFRSVWLTSIAPRIGSLGDLLRSPARNSSGGYHDESTPTRRRRALMRGRKPRPFSVAPGDLPLLQEVARSRSLLFFQVQHARIVLAVAEGQRVQEVAAQMRCDPSTVWRLCRRYEQGGLAWLLADLPRRFPPCSGPRSSNWPAWSQWPRGCTSPTGAARIWPVRPSPTASSRPSARRWSAAS